jgi:type VI secretion system protein
MPAGPSLYDMLLGQIDGAPLGNHDDRTLEILSLQVNIRRILNTRAGGSQARPRLRTARFHRGVPESTRIGS